MTTLWRISNYVDLSGEGARIASGRWHTEGNLVVYLAENPAAALLERIVHLTDLDEGGDLPPAYTLLRISVPEAIQVMQLNPMAPAHWRDRIEDTRSIGDGWLASRETPLARVPSVLAPHTWNVLLNPEHPHAAQVQIAEVIRERFDSRLFHFDSR
jgi:RES domain-containing protein